MVKDFKCTSYHQIYFSLEVLNKLLHVFVFSSWRSYYLPPCWFLKASPFYLVFVWSKFTLERCGIRIYRSLSLTIDSVGRGKLGIVAGFLHSYPVGTKSGTSVKQSVQTDQALHCWLTSLKFLSWFPQNW